MLMINYPSHKVPDYYNFSKLLVFLLIPWNYGSQPCPSLSILLKFAGIIIDQRSVVFNCLGDHRAPRRIVNGSQHEICCSEANFRG